MQQTWSEKRSDLRSGFENKIEKEKMKLVVKKIKTMVKKMKQGWTKKMVETTMGEW